MTYDNKIIGQGGAGDANSQFHNFFFASFYNSQRNVQCFYIHNFYIENVV